MLVLSRKVGQSIRLADDIEVVITSIRGNRVELGIVAPREVLIQRSELCDPSASPPKYVNEVSRNAYR